MKRWLILLLLCSSCFGAIARVGTPASNSTAGATTLPVTYSPVSGNAVFFFVQTNGSATISSVTDNGSGGSSTYSSMFNGACNTPGAYNCGFFYTCNVKASVTTITANFSGSDAGAAVVVEYSGLLTAACNDQTSAGATGSGTAQTAGSIATTQASELIIGAFLADGSTASVGTGSYATLKSQGCGTCGSEISTVDQIVAATNTYSATGSTSPTSVTWNGHTVSFKGAAAAGIGPQCGFKGKVGLLGKAGCV